MNDEWVETDNWTFEGEPAKPLQSYGEVRYLGWDITDRWAIDATGTFWMQQGAHGGPLYRRDHPEEVLASIEDDHHELRKIRLALYGTDGSDDEFWRLNERIRALKDDLRIMAAENEQWRAELDVLRSEADQVATVGLTWKREAERLRVGTEAHVHLTQHERDLLAHLLDAEIQAMWETESAGHSHQPGIRMCTELRDRLRGEAP